MAALTPARAINILQRLETRFAEAGQLACDLQQNAAAYTKSETGHAEADIVTDADIAVQEFLLATMANTALTECRLLAEEETPAITKFNPSGTLFLTLDPINGTSLYAAGKQTFNLIVCLHDGRAPLYTFSHYPGIHWTHHIVGQAYVSSGRTPNIALRGEEKKIIVYSYGEPQRVAPELYQRLTAQGFVFRLRRELTDEFGGTTLFLARKTSGYYSENPLAYDALVALHYAQASNEIPNLFSWSRRRIRYFLNHQRSLRVMSPRLLSRHCHITLMRVGKK